MIIYILELLYINILKSICSDKCCHWTYQAKFLKLKLKSDQFLSFQHKEESSAETEPHHDSADVPGLYLESGPGPFFVSSLSDAWSAIERFVRDKLAEWGQTQNHFQKLQTW